MSFLGIEIGSSGIRASRVALERTGHNISMQILKDIPVRQLMFHQI
jgi:hypothetical protein